MIRSISLVLCSMVFLVACGKKQEVAVTETPVSKKAPACVYLNANESCKLSQVLETPNLVWALRCDAGKTVVAKFRALDTSGDNHILFWVNLKNEPDVALDTKQALFAYFSQGTISYGKNILEWVSMDRGVWAEEIEKFAPNARLYMKRAPSDCVSLRVNATE